MLKKALPLLLAPLFLAGCSTTFTNMTPKQQTRDPNNLYPVGVALATRQQTLRWDSIQPYLVVGAESFPLRPTPLMTNRWEGLISMPAGTNFVQYRYKFDFKYNAFGSPPKADSAFSPKYTLRVVGK
jgi:hypothetical protein